MSRALSIGIVAPVARAVPPAGSGSVELMTSLLVEGLVHRGHQVTLFATGNSKTEARLSGRYDQGYAEGLPYWPWEFCEMLHVASAVERAHEFDLLHAQAEYYPVSLAFGRLSAAPLLHTVHHAPAPQEIELWSQYPDAPFIAISALQAQLLRGLRVAGVVRHGLPVARFTLRETPGDYLAFLGRFTPGKGVLEAIAVARRVGCVLKLAAPANEYYRDTIAPHVDGRHVEYVGELSHDDKVAFLGGARALLYPVLAPEPFGLVQIEAMLCGTPVAALRRGAVTEVIEEQITGATYDTLDELADGLSGLFGLDRRRVRAAAEQRHSSERMVDEYVAVYETALSAVGR